MASVTSMKSTLQFYFASSSLQGWPLLESLTSGIAIIAPAFSTHPSPNYFLVESVRVFIYLSACFFGVERCSC